MCSKQDGTSKDTERKSKNREFKEKIQEKIFHSLRMRQKCPKEGSQIIGPQFRISGKGRRDFRGKFISKFKLALIRYLGSHSQYNSKSDNFRNSRLIFFSFENKRDYLFFLLHKSSEGTVNNN